jgi:hypothetical protein
MTDNTDNITLAFILCEFLKMFSWSIKKERKGGRKKERKEKEKERKVEYREDYCLDLTSIVLHITRISFSIFHV